MLAIQGTIQLIPNSIATEAGTLRVDENNVQPAVVQTIETLSGLVQIVYPVTHIDKVISSLQAAKEEAEKEAPKTSDLYIPNSAQEVDAIAEAHQQIKKGA